MLPSPLLEPTFVSGFSVAEAAHLPPARLLSTSEASPVWAPGGGGSWCLPASRGRPLEGMSPLLRVSSSLRVLVSRPLITVASCPGPSPSLHIPPAVVA